MVGQIANEGHYKPYIIRQEHRRKTYTNKRYVKCRMKHIREQKPNKLLTPQNVSASSNDIIDNNVGVSASTTSIQSYDVLSSDKLPNEPVTSQSQVIINISIINNDPVLINESPMDPSVDDMCEPASSSYKE